MGNHSDAVKLQTQDARQDAPREISMLEVLRLFSYETPPYVRLNKLQFHRFQDSMHPAEQNSSPVPVRYHVHVYGEILDKFSKSEALTEKFISRLQEIECFRKVQLMHPAFGTDTISHEFELMAVI